MSDAATKTRKVFMTRSQYAKAFAWMLSNKDRILADRILRDQLRGELAPVIGMTPTDGQLSSLAKEAGFELPRKPTTTGGAGGVQQFFKGYRRQINNLSYRVEMLEFMHTQLLTQLGHKKFPENFTPRYVPPTPPEDETDPTQDR